jgi:membrane-bound lytic murein transglycosylase B
MAKTRKETTKQANYLKRHGWRDREEYLSHLYLRKNKQWNDVVKALSTIADIIGELDLQALGRRGGRTRAKNLTKQELFENW